MSILSLLKQKNVIFVTMSLLAVYHFPLLLIGFFLSLAGEILFGKLEILVAVSTMVAGLGYWIYKNQHNCDRLITMAMYTFFLTIWGIEAYDMIKLSFSTSDTIITAKTLHILILLARNHPYMQKKIESLGLTPVMDLGSIGLPLIRTYQNDFVVGRVAFQTALKFWFYVMPIKWYLWKIYSHNSTILHIPFVGNVHVWIGALIHIISYDYLQAYQSIRASIPNYTKDQLVNDTLKLKKIVESMPGAGMALIKLLFRAGVLACAWKFFDYEYRSGISNTSFIVVIVSTIFLLVTFTETKKTVTWTDTITTYICGQADPDITYLYGPKLSGPFVYMRDRLHETVETGATITDLYHDYQDLQSEDGEKEN